MATPGQSDGFILTFPCFMVIDDQLPIVAFDQHGQAGFCVFTDEDAFSQHRRQFGRNIGRTRIEIENERELKAKIFELGAQTGGQVSNLIIDPAGMEDNPRSIAFHQLLAQIEKGPLGSAKLLCRVW